MSTNLTPENEAFLADVVARGMFPSTGQALDEAIRLLRRQAAIEEALTAGLNSGPPIRIDAAYWDAQREKILKEYEARQK